MMSLINSVIHLVEQAGTAILPYWKKQLSIHTKQDNSPITDADLAANTLLINGLKQLTPDIPIISEEACQTPLNLRKHWEFWWLIDPLDGTKEFIDGREDFTVNVALIKNGQVMFGVVGIPVQQTCYAGGKTIGAWRVDHSHRSTSIHCRPAQQNELQIVASHRHSSPQQQALIEKLQQITTVSTQQIGSSLKFCLLAEGKADCYPRFAPTSQWDTAAAQGVLEGAGGEVLTDQGKPLDYLPQETYLNPYFIALADTAYWKPLIF